MTEKKNTTSIKKYCELLNKENPKQPRWNAIVLSKVCDCTNQTFTQWDKEEKKSLRILTSAAITIDCTVGELVENYELEGAKARLLPKKLSNEAYKNANKMDYYSFVEWWDKQ